MPRPSYTADLEPGPVAIVVIHMNDELTRNGAVRRLVDHRIGASQEFSDPDVAIFIDDLEAEGADEIILVCRDALCHFARN